MANNDNVVDISSNKQVFKLYNKKGRVRRILCLIFSILFLLGGSGLVYYYAVLNSLNFVDISKDNNNTGKSGGGQTNATMPSVGELEGSGTHLTIGEGELLQDSKVLNVMLFGEDNKGEDEHGRTDTMIMMSVDNRHKKIKLTSFQRDTYVYIPGHGNNKINAAYTLGGPKLTIETIEANFGIKVDRYAVVDFDSGGHAGRDHLHQLSDVQKRSVLRVVDHQRAGGHRTPDRSGSALVRAQQRSDAG